MVVFRVDEILSSLISLKEPSISFSLILLFCFYHIYLFIYCFLIKWKKKETNVTFFLKKKRINKTKITKANKPKVTPTPIPTAWLLWSFSFLERLQFIPSPKYPSLHSHEKLPDVFIQFASLWHPPLFVEHSLISMV